MKRVKKKHKIEKKKKRKVLSKRIDNAENLDKMKKVLHEILDLIE